MSGSADEPGLPAQVRAEHALMDAFAELLRSEQRALIRGDADALAAITRAKSDLAEQSGQLAADRDQRLRCAGFAPGTRGMDAWARANPRAQADWEALRRQTGEVQKLNRSNGMLIAIRLGQVHRALAVLLAGTANAALTYSADGRTRIATASRPLASA
jgi:flagellar biosynthesis protein FlgN